MASPARSEPAPGSENSWHQMSSVVASGRSSFRFTSSVCACSRTVGAAIPYPIGLSAERHRAARALQDAVGDGLQAARNPEAAEALREVHPGQPGVVAGAEKVGDGDRLRVVVGDDLSGEIGDPIRISGVAHPATIGNRRWSTLAGPFIRASAYPCRSVRTVRRASLRKRLDGLTIRDAARLGRRLKNLRGAPTPTSCGRSPNSSPRPRRWSRPAPPPSPTITYPDLPVSERRDEIAKAISEHQVVVVAGETGSGKTTQLPKICLELGRGIRGTIGHTQPRRLAARTVAQRIADELGTPLGDAVGYTVRFTDQASDRTLVKLMTDGILLAEIQRDRRLLRYDTLILDEAHERSLNIDFLLGYLRELLPRRPDLKVIVTSATIEPERFAAHFAWRRCADRRGVRAHLPGRDPLPPTGSPGARQQDDDDPDDPDHEIVRTEMRDQTEAIVDAIGELESRAARRRAGVPVRRARDPRHRRSFARV